MAPYPFAIILGGGRNFRIRLRDESGASQLVGMDYYSDDYPDVSLEEFLAVYERLTTFARREVHELAMLLAGGLVSEEES